MVVVEECCRGGLKEVGATAYHVALVQGALYHSWPEGERRGGVQGDPLGFLCGLLRYNRSLNVLC